MLKVFDEGRSRSFYCIATTLLPIGGLAAALENAKKKIKADKVGTNDIKTRAKILRGFLENFPNALLLWSLVKTGNLQLGGAERAMPFG